MADESIEYLSQKAFDNLAIELNELKSSTLPALAKRIDDARQMGDLSENAEYHAAREELAWAQSRVREIERILGNAMVVSGATQQIGVVSIGSAVTVVAGGKTRTFTIVGAQEAKPAEGKISNESPLGQALLGRGVGTVVEVSVPAGVQKYEILEVK